jgi:hypothetical protein
MNTVFLANQPEVLAFELLETKRNTLLQPTSMYLVQAIKFDKTNTHCLLGVTVYQDCIEVLNCTNLKYSEINLDVNELVKIASDNIIPELKPFYFENTMALQYQPQFGHEFYQDEIGMTIHRILIMSIPPFSNYSILNQ